MNRHNGPEDQSLGDRCMLGREPDFNAFRRIVQGPDSVAIGIDTGQGQGYQRVVYLTGKHPPASIRLRHGDSRGRFEGNSLVVETTNFSPKLPFRGAAENLTLVEKFTRIDAKTLEYQVTVTDPTVWTAPWTVRQEMKMQPDDQNRIYYEPRCHEGNYGLAALLIGARVDEKRVQGRPRPRSGVAGHRDRLRARALEVRNERARARRSSIALVGRRRRSAHLGGHSAHVRRDRPGGRARPTASRTSTASGRRSTKPTGICRRTRRAPEWSRSRASTSSTTPGCPAAPVVALGAAAGVPASLGVVQGDGQIPYTPEAAKIKQENARELDRPRSRAQVLPAGHSARDVHAVSVRDRAGHRQDSHDLRVLERRPRDSPEQGRRPARRHLHGPLGRALGRRYAGRRGDELQRQELVRSRRQLPQRDAAKLVERYTPISADAIRYDVTIEDPKTFTRPWTIAMPLYRRLEENATVLDYPCIEFSEEFMYGHLRKEPLVTRWEGETMVVEITRKIPPGDKLHEWYRR